jgi:hypothetical protein
LNASPLPSNYFDGQFGRADVRAAAQIHESAFFYAKLMAAESRHRAVLLIAIVGTALLALFLREINLWELAAVLFASEVGLTRVAQPYVAWYQMSKLQTHVNEVLGRHLASAHDAKVIYAELLALYARYFDIKARCGVRTSSLEYAAANARLTSSWKSSHLGFFVNAEKTLAGRASG